VVLHEGGHFFFSKLFKVKVEKFFLFFDAWNVKLFSTKMKWFTRLFPKMKDNETEYGVGWLPFGGYVKIAGMVDESMDKEQLAQEPQPWEFRSKPAWQRLLIMIGGVLVNFLLAIFIYSMITFYYGESYIKPVDMTYGLKFNEQAKENGFRDGDIIVKVDGKEVKTFTNAIMRDISNAEVVTVLRNGQEMDIELPGKLNLLDMLQSEPPYVTYLLPNVVDSVFPGSPAAKAGMKKGDKITALNGNKVESFNDFTYYVSRIKDAVVENASHEDSLKARSVEMVINGTDTVNTVLTSDFMVGFSAVNPSNIYKITEKKYGFFESFPVGIRYGCKTLAGYVNDLKYIFTKKGARSVGGFVTMGQIFPSKWDWFSFWNLTAFFSIILAFMNILPIPALDGGHVLFLIYEVITGRKPSDKFLEYAEMVGLFLLLGLLLFANGNDILRLFGI